MNVPGPDKALNMYLFIYRLSCFITYSHHSHYPGRPALLYPPLVFSALHNPVHPEPETYFIHPFIHLFIHSLIQQIQLNHV